MADFKYELEMVRIVRGRDDRIEVRQDNDGLGMVEVVSIDGDTDITIRMPLDQAALVGAAILDTVQELREVGFK